MKKITLILAVLLFVAPAMGAVTLTATDLGDGRVSISYSGDAVSAFGIDITVESPAVITDVCDYNVGESVTGNIGYGIFPGTIDINTADGTVANDGTPVAPSDDPGAQTGLNTGGVTLEIGALYEDGNAPGTSGTLCVVVVDCNGATQDVNLTIAGNSTRGNVVLTDATEAISPNYNGCVVACDTTPPDCFLDVYGSNPAYANQVAAYQAYIAAGEDPSCWCQIYQCDGDADGLTQLVGKFIVYTWDLDLVFANWKRKITDSRGSNPCADIDHKSQLVGKFRVYTWDLDAVFAHWKKKATDPLHPGDCPRPD